MKKYFTKWLPVKGHISPFQMCLYADGTQGKSCDPYLSEVGAVPLKLFLCSSEINAGDTLVSKDGSKTVVPNFVLIKSERLSALAEEVKRFKVIGEVSPEAVWVHREDMWFEEADLQWALATNDQFQDVISECDFNDSVNNPRLIKKYVMFKCSTCKTFH